jgi:hypothetical protein
MYHMHHIIPRHMGGTDDPDNLIRLTIEEHAEEHRKLYEKYGKKEDYWAWKGLAGIIPRKELISEILKEAGIKGNKVANQNGAYLKANKAHVDKLKNDPEYRENWIIKNSKPKTNTENYFKPKSKKHAENIRKAALNRERIPCSTCGNGYTKANLEKHEKSCRKMKQNV